MVIALDKSIPKPDFLIIGTQKGGTTWLRRMLIEHPDVYIPPYPEEVHFFNRAILQPDLYLALFNIEEAKGKRLGEKSPNYFHMPEKSIAFVKEILPEAKLIILLRDPVKRAWSQARMHTSEFNRRELGKKDFLKLVLQVASKGNFERTNYATVIKRWLKYFSKDQLLVYYYDDLQANPQQFLNQVAADLALDHFKPQGLKERIHVSKTIEMPKMLHWFLQWRYRKIPQQLQNIGYQAPINWSENKINISFFAKIAILVLFLPYHLLTTVLYQVYKWQTNLKIQVPKIFWE